MAAQLCCFLVLLFGPLLHASAWSSAVHSSSHRRAPVAKISDNDGDLLAAAEATGPGTFKPPVSPPAAAAAALGRREAFSRFAASAVGAAAAAVALPAPALAYTADSDPVRESLYFVSRVQEATVQQERFVRRTERQEDLKKKMKLTLRLVEKNYRLLDQINYLSAYVQPPEEVVTATTAGYEAAESLQAAIDYVNSSDGLGTGPLTDEQRGFLTTNLRTCREELFNFLAFVPQEKLARARRRVEEENAANRDEYGGDGSEGVYDPVVLPWKDRQ